MRQLEVAGVPIVRSVGRTGGQLVPPDRVTHTRIHFYTLRLAKSDVFTPRLWEWQWAVDQYMRERSELPTCPATGANTLTRLRPNTQKYKDSEADSGYSDG